jgi:hypothetical protein
MDCISTSVGFLIFQEEIMGLAFMVITDDSIHLSIRRRVVF